MAILHNEFLAVILRVDGKHRATCPEIPEAYGLGPSPADALMALRDAVEQLLESRRELAFQLATDEITFDTIVID